MKPQNGVAGIGTPVVDLPVPVPERFLRHVPGRKGGRELMEPAAMQTLLQRLSEPPRPGFGGSAANVVLQLARLGMPTALFGTVGSDAEGDFIRAELRRFHSSVRHLKTSAAAPTARCLCLITPDGERTMRSSLGAGLEFAPEKVTARDLEGFRIVMIEGYLLAGEPDKVRKLFATAQDSGCVIALDLASFEIVRDYRDFLLEILKEYVDVVFANADESEMLWGHCPAVRQIGRFRELCPVAVLKRGKDAALAASPDEGPVRIAPAKVEAKDTTAAGDAFAAGFLFGYLRELPLAQCVRLGHAVAGEVVQVIGTEIPPAGWQRIMDKTAKMLKTVSSKEETR